MPEPSAVGLLCRSCRTAAQQHRSQPRACRVCSGCSPGKPAPCWSCQSRDFGVKAALGGTAGMGCAVEAEELASGSCSSLRSACGHSHGDALPRPPHRCNSTSCPLRRIQATLLKLRSAGSAVGTVLPVWGRLHEHGQGNEERTQTWAHTAPPPRLRCCEQRQALCCSASYQPE